jgi:hypothetical protein
VPWLTSGSTAAYSALFNVCLAEEKMAIVQYSPRALSLPRLAAMWPEPECPDPYRAAGFYLIHLPFREDIREKAVRLFI